MNCNAHHIQAKSIVDDVMRAWPATIRVFLDFRMDCVGCPIAPFHTVSESCQAYGVETATLITALLKAQEPN